MLPSTAPRNRSLRFVLRTFDALGIAGGAEPAGIEVNVGA